MGHVTVVRRLLDRMPPTSNVEVSLASAASFLAVPSAWDSGWAMYRVDGASELYAIAAAFDGPFAGRRDRHATPSDEQASCTTKFCDVFCRSLTRT